MRKNIEYLIAGVLIPLTFSLSPNYANAQTTLNQPSLTSQTDKLKATGLDIIIHTESGKFEVDGVNVKEIFSNFNSRIKDPHKFKGFYDEENSKYYRCLSNENGQLVAWFVYAVDSFTYPSLLESVSIIKQSKVYNFLYGHSVPWREWDNFEKVDAVIIAQIGNPERKKMSRLGELSDRYKARNQLKAKWKHRKM